MQIAEQLTGSPKEVSEVRTGSYEKVVLERASPISKQAIRVAKTGIGFGERIKNLLLNTGQAPDSNEHFSPVTLAQHIYYGKITDLDVADLARLVDKKRGTADQMKAASIVAIIAGKDRRVRRNLLKSVASASEIADEENLRVSDLLEVLPPEVAAGLVLALANPTVSKNIKDGLGLPGTEGIDTIHSAIGGIILLPANSRKEIIGAAQRIDPTAALNFWKLLISNWFQNDEYGGRLIINRSLDPAKVEDKIAEVQEEHGPTARMLRGETTA